MIKYILRQCNAENSPIRGKFFAYPVTDETVDLKRLAVHMSEHNSPYSHGVIQGVMTDMVACIKELLLDGKKVKLDQLAIFSVGIKNTPGGADTEEEFSVTKNINNVKLRSRATGSLSVTQLNLDATLKKAVAV